MEARGARKDGAIILSLFGFSSTTGQFYKKDLLNTTQLAGWMKTGSPKAKKHDISWA